jgi:hypothetical protein
MGVQPHRNANVLEKVEQGNSTGSNKCRPFVGFDHHGNTNVLILDQCQDPYDFVNRLHRESMYSCASHYAYM